SPERKKCRRQLLEKGINGFANVDPLGEVELVVTGEKGHNPLAQVLLPDLSGHLLEILHEETVEEVLIIGGVLLPGRDKAGLDANLAVLREFRQAKIVGNVLRFPKDVGVLDRTTEIESLTFEFLATG